MSDARMLPAQLDIVAHGQTVPDIEKLCRAILRNALGTRSPEALRRGDGTRTHLEPADYDEALAHLIGQAWILAVEKFEPRPGILLRPWLYQRLGFALTDYLRSQYGKKGQKRAHDAAGAPSLDDGATPVDPLGGVVAEGPGYRPEDWADAVERLGDRPDRETLWAERELGFGPDRGVALRGDSERPREPGAAASVAATVGRRPAWQDCSGCGWRHYRDSSGGPAFPSCCTGCGAVMAAPTTTDEEMTDAA